MRYLVYKVVVRVVQEAHLWSVHIRELSSSEEHEYAQKISK